MRTAVDRAPSELKMYGDAGEVVSCLSGNRTDLNLVRHNFPIYDNSGEDGVGSVKVFATRQPELSDRVIARYISAFDTARGYGDLGKFNRAAAGLREAAEHGISVPQPIREAETVEEIKQYLHDHAEIHIPNNHVPKVRERLERHVRAFPEGYGLAAEDLGNISSVTDRIVPLPVSSDTIRSMVEEHMAIRRDKRSE